jgi:hypothetical protein
MDRWKQFEELSLLWSWGAELCLSIVGSSQVRSHLSARMRAASLYHIKMAGKLIALRAAVSSVAELLLGRLPNETTQVDVMNELVAKFPRREELRPARWTATQSGPMGRSSGRGRWTA